MNTSIKNITNTRDLINELKIIRDIIKEISNKSISGYNTINIYSDHGFSF